jgi:membrane protein implicated in regulation of membrane protease activity
MTKGCFAFFLHLILILFLLHLLLLPFLLLFLFLLLLLLLLLLLFQILLPTRGGTIERLQGRVQLVQHAAEERGHA